MTTTSLPPAPVARRRPLAGGRLAMVIVGAIVSLLGLGLIGGGIAVATVGQSRDDDGFLTTGPVTLSTDTYAVAVRDVGVDVRGPDQAYARGVLGTVRIRATAADPAKPVFVGIAKQGDVDAYLDGVGHADVSDLDVDPTRVTYAPHAGGAPATAPAALSIWDSSDSGTGTRTREWDLSTGYWAVVVMNADGSQGVRAQVDLGGELPVVRWAWIGLLAGGAVFLLGGALLVLLPLTVGRRP